MLNRYQISSSQIGFQDFVESSQALEVGSFVEVNNGGPWSAKRFQVLSKEIAPCGTLNNFVAGAV